MALLLITKSLVTMRRKETNGSNPIEYLFTWGEYWVEVADEVLSTHYISVKKATDKLDFESCKS